MEILNLFLSDNTEEALGKAIKESGIDRNELFITTKLWNNFHEAKHVRPALNMSLENLQMDHVDLYLMHWPISFEFKGYQEASDEMNLKQTHVPIMETWRAMEQLVREGVAHSIGVSNFTIEQLKEILQQCEIPPAVNQIEIHPRLVQQDMVTFCKEHQIVLTAYSPLGNPGYRAAQLKSVDEPKVK
jgi:diketogulonate reductase-like aldo/keto reductase